MRKPLIATTAACLLSLGSITGCGEKSEAVQTAEQLDVLIDKMSNQLRASSAAMDGNTQLYSLGTTIDGVAVPGALSFDAAYIDQSLALLPLAREIAAGKGNESQKKTANGIIAAILADESAYLINIAQAGYQHTSNQISDMRPRVAMLEEIVQINDELSGDRAAEIETYRTGKVDADTSVQGINQLTQEAKTAGEAQQAARADLAKLTARIDELGSEVAEYEALELKLTNESLGAAGSTKFEKLDQATTASYEAQMAQSKAQTLELEAAIAESLARLAQVKQERSAAVVEQLEAKIDQIEAEKRLIADKLAELESDRKATVDTLIQTFARLDTQIQVLGFKRMADAQTKLEEASQALTAAGRNRSDEMLSVYMLRARSLQQQSLAARSYGALLDSLAASGEDVLGKGLHGALTARSAQMKTLVAKAATDADALIEQAGDAVADLENSADASTPAGQAAVSQAQLIRQLVSSAKTGSQTGTSTGGQPDTATDDAPAEN